MGDSQQSRNDLYNGCPILRSNRESSGTEPGAQADLCVETDNSEVDCFQNREDQLHEDKLGEPLRVHQKHGQVPDDSQNLSVGSEKI